MSLKTQMRNMCALLMLVYVSDVVAEVVHYPDGRKVIGNAVIATKASEGFAKVMTWQPTSLQSNLPKVALNFSKVMGTDGERWERQLENPGIRCGSAGTLSKTENLLLPAGTYQVRWITYVVPCWATDLMPEHAVKYTADRHNPPNPVDLPRITVDSKVTGLDSRTGWVGNRIEYSQSEGKKDGLHSWSSNKVIHFGGDAWRHEFTLSQPSSVAFELNAQAEPCKNTHIGKVKTGPCFTAAVIQVELYTDKTKLNTLHAQLASAFQAAQAATKVAQDVESTLSTIHAAAKGDKGLLIDLVERHKRGEAERKVIIQILSELRLALVSPSRSADIPLIDQVTQQKKMDGLLLSLQILLDFSNDVRALLKDPENIQAWERLEQSLHKIDAVLDGVETLRAFVSDEIANRVVRESELKSHLELNTQWSAK